MVDTGDRKQQAVGGSRSERGEGKSGEHGWRSTGNAVLDSVTRRACPREERQAKGQIGTKRTQGDSRCNGEKRRRMADFRGVFYAVESSS